AWCHIQLKQDPKRGILLHGHGHVAIESLGQLEQLVTRLECALPSWEGSGQQVHAHSIHEPNSLYAHNPIRSHSERISLALGWHDYSSRELEHRAVRVSRFRNYASLDLGMSTKSLSSAVTALQDAPLYGVHGVFRPGNGLWQAHRIPSQIPEAV
ncbi:MAG: hypothetical protein P1V97_29085, partial [Planctomycetota bacterium]|nr:hypothetical protein [Planctomycetota bacterium]